MPRLLGYRENGAENLTYYRLDRTWRHLMHGTTRRGWEEKAMSIPERERDRLLLLQGVAAVAAQRRARGLRLGYPEALALIRLHVLEGARDGHGVDELAESGRHVLGVGDVLPGVPELLQQVQVEATFAEGARLVSVQDPLGAACWTAPPPRPVRSDGLRAARPRQTLAVHGTGA